MSLSSAFLFVLCQPGAEAALKAELARSAPHLRPAFSRPGLVTFKDTTGEHAQEPTIDAVFARRMGLSLGSCATPAAVVTRALELELSPLRLHVCARDAHEADTLIDDDRLVSIETAIRALAPSTLFHASARAETNDRVLNVIVSDDEPLWLGVHVQRALQSPWPGGLFPIELPEHAPSRAYLKLAQALEWSRAPLRAGDMALEIGAAPGGATYALLERGVSVLGVDPGDMDPSVLVMVGPHDARLQHIKAPVGGLQREQLPARVEWLLLDVNLAPQVALRSIQRLVPPLRKHLLGMFLTLKLNDWSTADTIPRFLAQARELGLEQPRAVQLPAHRQEVLLFGLTAKGARR